MNTGMDRFIIYINRTFFDKMKKTQHLVVAAGIKPNYKYDYTIFLFIVKVNNGKITKIVLDGVGFL